MPKPVPMPIDFVQAAERYTTDLLSIGDLRREFKVSNHTIKKWLFFIGVPENKKNSVLSSKRLGTPSQRKGKKHSAESIEKMRDAAKNRKPTTLGFKFSDESKEKMRQSAKQRIATTDIYERMRLGRDKNKLDKAEVVARDKVRQACKRMLRRILTMSRVKKDGRRSELLLGYTKQDLRSHIESQFKVGMSWGARDSFHIDHIKPVAQFLREGVHDPAVINALNNLQVLTPQENRAKSDSFSEKPRRMALVIDSTGTRGYA